MGERTYSAFISYNHRDRAHATRLHRALERYRVPKRLRGRPVAWGTLGGRLPPVFRDRDELAASPDLAESVRQALDASATLVVICSPNAAKSKWVNEEIRTFIRSGREDRIRLMIVDGEPGDPERECLPPAVSEMRSEPLAADARKGQDGLAGAKLKILAGMLDVPYDELRRRETQRRTRRLTALAVASLAGFLIMTGLAAFAFIARNEAVRQRTIAEQRTETAERTLDFVKSMFRVSDPSEARGETITAREVVDRGAQRLEAGLQDQPTVRADLAVTLAEVYGSLGLLQRSDRLVRASFAIPHRDSAIQVRQLTALAESQSRLGEYEQSLATFRRALALAEGGEASSPRLRSRILIGLGQAHSALGNRAAADDAVHRALQLDTARHQGRPHPDIARDIEVLGLNAFYDGDLDGARRFIERALQMTLRLEGATSPSVADNRNTLASIAYVRGDLAEAERYFRENLASDERVLGREHPDLAATLNNLSHAVLDQRRFREAEALLVRAIAIKERQGQSDHDDMAFLYSNLAIAARHLGREAQALALFRRALAIARAREHRTLGPILADLAELHCRRDRAGEAMAMLAEAAQATARDYPDDAWRSAWVDSVRGECLVRQGRRAEALPLLRSSIPAIRERWPASTLYGSEAARRARLLS